MGYSDPPLVDRLNALPRPRCAKLTPFSVLEAHPETGFVRLRFSEQPAFGNHFGHVQGGFCVAMLDVILSLAVYARTGEFLTTLEIKSSFLEPTPIGECLGEGSVLRAGQSVVFAEARLWSADAILTAHATGTSLGGRSPSA